MRANLSRSSNGPTKLGNFHWAFDEADDEGCEHRQEYHLDNPLEGGVLRTTRLRYRQRRRFRENRIRVVNEQVAV